MNWSAAAVGRQHHAEFFILIGGKASGRRLSSAPNRYGSGLADLTPNYLRHWKSEMIGDFMEYVAEIDRLRAELASRQIDIDTFREGNQKLRAELAAKDARIAELKEELAGINELHGQMCEAWSEACTRAALAPSPAGRVVSHEEGARMIQEPEPDDGAIVHEDGSVTRPPPAGDRRDALLYNAESQYCAGMSFGFELGRNDDRAELSRIITQRWTEIADAKARAALNPSPSDEELK